MASPVTRLILVFLLSFSGVTIGQELPPVINFDPIEYGAGNQNWMISQGEDKKMYIANGLGLLEYTGTSWNLYPVPNKTIVRSVKVVEDKIFTGAYMELGYWTSTNSGSLEYTSLLPLFPGGVNDGEQFWHIERIGSAVVFQSFEGIYLYDLEKNKISVLETPPGAIMNLFKVKGRLYFFTAEKGLFTIEKGSAKQVITEQALGDLEVMQLLPHDRGLELIARSGRIYIWNGQSLEQEFEELSAKLSGISVFSAVDSGDGTMFIGSVENGIYHVDKNGKIIHHFRQENGLQNNTVLDLFLDREKNVWAGLDNGLSVINQDSAFKIFQDNVGRIGTVYSSIKKDSVLYLGTNQGLYFRKDSEEDFEFIEGTNGQVWNLQLVDSTLFCGHNNGTFIVEGENARKISDRLGTWTVVKLKDRKNYYVQGHYNGISLLLKENGEFKDLPMIKDFPHSSKHIVSETDGDLWIGNEHKGVFRLKLKDSLNEIEDLKIYDFENINGITSSIFNFQGKLYYATRNRVFQFLPEKDEFVPNNPIANLLKGVNRSSGKFVPQEEQLWGFTEDALINIKVSDLSTGFSMNTFNIPKEYRNIPGGYDNVSKLTEERYILGVVDGYLVFDKDAFKINDDYKIRIDNILKSSVEEQIGAVSLDENGVFDFRHNNLSVKFSIPEYKKFVVPLYSYRLEGLSSRWSDWSPVSTATFENLPFGSYEFEVRGKIGEEVIPSTTYNFVIRRPWYFGNLAIAAYILLLGLILFLIHLAYKKDREKRIRENEKALKMRNLEAEQKIIKLQNEQLEKEMAGKSKELAVSTMSLIKKNEFLSRIKDKLQETENSSQVRSVIKTIDKDISEEDNWKFFKKAFSNADKDFFKKIKAQHPDLTSNDLKLCAYLRLNLSSKEIAPLLNISVKSVEIKRYRLRKKMALPREMNLVDYILEI